MSSIGSISLGQFSLGVMSLGCIGTKQKSTEVGTLYVVTIHVGTEVYIRKVKEGRSIGNLNGVKPSNNHIIVGWHDAEGNEITSDTIVTSDIDIYAVEERIGVGYSRIGITFKVA